MLNLFRKNTGKDRRQITVVIMIVVAIALIFYAVTLNLGRISQSKTQTQIGANTGAGALASSMASYGHALLMQQLGGERKKCASTGLLGAIIGAILAIIIVIVTWGTATPLAVAVTALGVIGAALAVVSVVLQITVVQPGITDAWNNIASEILDTVDQFMESALRSALQSSTGDNKQVPDLYDSDMDSIFGLHPGTGEPLDLMSRFAKYYDTVFNGVVINFLPAAEDFVVELQDFIYPVPGPNGDCYGTTCVDGFECDQATFSCQPAWALYDPLPGTFVPGFQTSTVNYSYIVPQVPGHPCNVDLNNFPPGFDSNPPPPVGTGDPFPFSPPSACNICCVPEQVNDPRGPAFPPIQLRPGCCDCRSKPPTIQIPDPANPPALQTVPNPDYCDGALFPPNLECGTASTCSLRSPYRLTEPTLGTIYQWVYDPFLEDTENGFFSFRELLGRDDEHQLYFKDSVDPNSFGPTYAAQRTPPWLGTNYYVDDATGFYGSFPAVPPAIPENRVGVFPFLWKVHDWGFDLDTLDTTGTLVIGNPVFNPFDQRCKWCDARAATTCSPNLPYEMTQLLLRNDPATQSYDTSYCVETGVDNVTLSLTGSLEIDADLCSPPNFDAAYQTGAPFWKRGADRFCSIGDIGGSDAWPYEGQCAKYFNGNCFLDINGNGSADCTPGNPVTDECDSAGNPITALCDCNDPTAATAADVDPTLFPEDPLDNFIYSLPEFIEFAGTLAAKSRGQLATQFPTWFADWQEWIDPGPWAGAATIPGSPTTGSYPDCFPFDEDDDPSTPDACLTEPGALYVWLRSIQAIKAELVQLRNVSFAAGVCDPWCVPQRGCPEVSLFEETTFDFNGDGVDGQLEDVIACLNFNIHGYDYSCNGGTPSPACVNAPGVFLGNDTRYNNCKLNCSLAECTDLPRTVVPNPPYDPAGYVQANPADEPDMAAMLQCLHACSDLTCRGTPAGLPFVPGASPLPLTQSSSGAAYPYAANLPTFNQIFDCSGTDLNDVNNFRTDIANALIQANPICDINPGGWLALTGTAALEAENQIDKFIVRRDYLEGRLTELNGFIDILTAAEIEFASFIEGGVTDLINERIAYEAAPPEAFPFHVIYGWQDDRSPEVRQGLPGAEAYWHIVKVEGRIPSRCDDRCGVGNGPDPEWPKVKTYTKKAGFKRCYELVNTDGIVKFRVTRFDESPQSNSGGVLFPNGQPIWKFRFFHPNPERGEVSASTLGSTCDSIMITDPLVPLATFKGAFLMNRRIGASAGDPVLGNNFQCWNRAHFIMANSGIMTETCAQYYYKDGARRGMTFSFIDCPANF